jgi:hypothetical protein
MQARYYDPVIVRFYSNDPVGFRDIHSFNRYAYANNNPYRYIDPDGKESWAITGSYNVMPARKKLTGGQPQKGDLTRTIGVVGGGAAAVGTCGVRYIETKTYHLSSSLPYWLISCLVRFGSKTDRISHCQIIFCVPVFRCEFNRWIQHTA